MRTPSNRKHFIVQERDLEILRYIKDSKTMNLPQIWRRFWQGKSQAAAHKRMQELTASKLIVQVNMELLKFSVHYYLTKNGLEQLVANNQAIANDRLPLPEATDIIRSDFQHNLRVTDMRIALEIDSAIRIKNWISDEWIKADGAAFGLGPGTQQQLKGIRINREKEDRFKCRIPDALFDLEDAQHEVKICFEYEHGQYRRWKFKAYISAWEERWGEYQKFIVAATPERAITLRKWCLEDLKQRHRLKLADGTVQLDDLAGAYMFTDYHSLVDNGLIKSAPQTPLSPVRFYPIEA
jgi:hypothetical protein